MDILRFITAGNVDDGKSTLIGRLLYDTENIKTDVLESVSAENVNLAHITDGLRAERQQGITIDVAYKYFTTKNRKYIVTDAPGHFQYTKNLVTGASGVDVMIILIDAQNGITEQTKRHSLVASFLKIKQIVVAINKIDAMEYGEEVFSAIKNEYSGIVQKLQLGDVTFIPISALLGDNVSFASKNMDWYGGVTLMQYLESTVPRVEQHEITRVSVQCAVHSESFGKGHAGKVLSGKLRTGDVIAVYPAGLKSVIRMILHGYVEMQEATAGQNIMVYLENNIEVNRGDIIAYADDAPLCAYQFEASICWLDSSEALQIDTDYFLRINGMETICKIINVISMIDINSFDKTNYESPIEANQFAEVVIETQEAMAFDKFSLMPENGRGIIINAQTNYTSGAFTIN
jgi:sulfate adenylyltransferase subunit 1